MREGQSLTAKLFQKLLGLTAAASNVVIFDLLHMRPLQWWLRTTRFSQRGNPFLHSKLPLPSPQVLLYYLVTTSSQLVTSMEIPLNEITYIFQSVRTNRHSPKRLVPSGNQGYIRNLGHFLCPLYTNKNDIMSYRIYYFCNTSIKSAFINPVGISFICLFLNLKPF